VTPPHHNPATSVDQRRAAPGGDAVGRDKITNMHVVPRRTQIEGWIERLADELRDKVEVRDFVESLQYYLQPTPSDGIIGLEAKLDHAGRSTQKRAALRKKEAFAKLLETWRSYPAAQEIIAYFLTKIEAAFEVEVLPLLAGTRPEDIDAIITLKLVDPVLAEMGCAPFMLNYVTVFGMVYWLAEQCYIRWHQ
jgi:hypothetical protein